MSIQAILGDKGRDVATVGADARLSEAVRVLGEKRIGALPVVEDGRIVGIMGGPPSKPKYSCMTDSELVP